MERIDILINQSRRETENEEFTSTAGIETDEILRYFNAAQVRLQSKISGTHANVFQSEKIIDTVAQQEAYDIPENAFLGNRVDLIEYSRTGVEQDYYRLEQLSLAERVNTRYGTNVPFGFIRRSGQILLQSKPSSSGAKIRMTYQKRLPKLDVRRGQVSAVTLDTVARTITSLTLTTGADLDAAALTERGFITIVTGVGVQQMRNIPIDSVDESSGVVERLEFRWPERADRGRLPGGRGAPGGR